MQQHVDSVAWHDTRQSDIDKMAGNPIHRAQVSLAPLVDLAMVCCQAEIAELRFQTAAFCFNEGRGKKALKQVTRCRTTQRLCGP